MSDLGRTLVVAGLVLAAAGVVVMIAARAGTPLGRLPGDLAWKGKGFSVSVPLATGLVLSIVLTVLANLFLRSK
jgi:uncharacterized membrane protein